MKRIGAAVLAVAVAAGLAAQRVADPGPMSFDAPVSARPAAKGRAVPKKAPRPTARPAPTRAAAPLRFADAGGDGDSWRDRSGRELRLGLVNAPETNECFAAQATARRTALVAPGFRVRTYATDTYGRAVSVVVLRDGRNLNVLLAREGYVNDRYLAQFRHENEPLARRLDAAFADAKAARRGLWGSCGTRAAPPRPVAPAPPAPAAPGCHPDYATCIPVRGDGSGHGAANDLDCGEIRRLVQLRRAGVDPYRLDADGDGTGCDSYG